MGLQLNHAHQPPLRRRLLGPSKGQMQDLGYDFAARILEPFDDSGWKVHESPGLLAGT